MSEATEVHRGRRRRQGCHETPWRQRHQLGIWGSPFHAQRCKGSKTDRGLMNSTRGVFENNALAREQRYIFSSLYHETDRLCVHTMIKSMHMFAECPFHSWIRMFPEYMYYFIYLSIKSMFLKQVFCLLRKSQKGIEWLKSWYRTVYEESPWSMKTTDV